MIEEIKQVAGRLGVNPSIVEKDYVISLVLRALWSSGAWRVLVFKGGTALRKVYFPDYRFSEDLDFNLIGGSVADVMRALDILERMGGEIEFESIEFRERYGRRYHAGKKVGYEIRIPYRLLRRHGDASKIRMDITAGEYERMVLDPVIRGINHVYSDAPAFSMVRVMVYPMEEIMAEKIRTIYQRSGRARDIYDIWYLSKHVDMDTVLSIIKPKFEVKNLQFESGRVARLRDIYRDNWDQLSHLIGSLPDFDEVWTAVMEICTRVERIMEQLR